MTGPGSRAHCVVIRYICAELKGDIRIFSPGATHCCSSFFRGGVLVGGARPVRGLRIKTWLFRLFVHAAEQRCPGSARGESPVQGGMKLPEQSPS